MPTVPRIERQIATSPIQGGQLSQPPAGAFDGLNQTMGATEGFLVNEANRAVGEANRAKQIALDAKKQVDQVVVLESDMKLSKLRTDLEVQRNQLKGKDAVGSIDFVTSEWQKGVDDIEQGLTNDEQRMAFTNRATHHWNGLYEGTMKYSNAEMNRYTDDNYSAAFDLRVVDAIVGDDTQMAVSMNELKALLKDYYKDPLVVEDKFNDYMKTVRTGRKERQIEIEKANKEAIALAQDDANKDLTDLEINGKLSILELRKRREVLNDTDYKTWYDRYKANIKKSERGEGAVDDPKASTDLTVEAMTMPVNLSSEELSKFKRKVADAVSSGTLKPSTGRQIVADAENATKIDPMRKAAEDAVVQSLKNDYNQGFMGKSTGGKPTPEADKEYIKQVEAFRKWSRANTDKDPSEYYENVSRPYLMDTWYGGTKEEKDYKKRREEMGLTVPAVKPKITPEQAREELRRRGKL